MIDYTLLSPDSTTSDIVELCEKAHKYNIDATQKYNISTVCVLPEMVLVAKETLDKLNSSVGITTVISFPDGTLSPEVKDISTLKAIKNGVTEIDMVMDYNKLKDGEEIFHYNEINNISNLCHKNNVIFKVIVESGLLTDEETRRSTMICIKSGVDYIKTSTGMVEIGAEIEKVKIMYDTIHNMGSDMKIKASGGIRTMGDIELFKPYVNRFGIGSSSVDQIFKLTV